MKTLVKFLIDIGDEAEEQDQVFAYFPNDNWNSTNTSYKSSYSHIGQHSACLDEYANDCPAATPEQYADLKQELESIGYNLKVCK
jgi:hypothetical protein